MANASDHGREARRRNGIEPLFQAERGESVWVRHTYGLTSPEWRRGVVTDTFISPVSRKRVVVVAGNGYYPHEVRSDDGERDGVTLTREHTVGGLAS